MRGLILNRNKYVVEKTRREAATKAACVAFASLLAIASISLICINAHPPTSASAEKTAVAPSSSAADTLLRESNSADKNNSEIETKSPNEQGSRPTIIKSSAKETYLVTKVVDGDTIYVSGIKTRIRLIGVNTPETVSSSKPVQCYGHEASNYLNKLLLGKKVSLESDSASGDTDIYGRPLRYVYYGGENVNQLIIMNGFGKEADYGNNYRYKDSFVASQKYAIQNEIGLWAKNTCNGQE